MSWHQKFPSLFLTLLSAGFPMKPIIVGLVDPFSILAATHSIDLIIYFQIFQRKM
jgi:hypothetical protein